MPHDVFISHSHEDKLTADAACAVLERNGIRCWIAPRDVIFGADYSDQITQAIEDCRALVLIFSTHSNASNQVKAEIDAAFSNNKALFPFRIEDIKPSKGMAHYLRTVHWLDAFPPPRDAHLQTMAERILRLFPDRAQSAPTAPQSGGTQLSTPVEVGKKPKTHKLLWSLVAAAGALVAAFAVMQSKRDRQPVTPNAAGVSTPPGLRPVVNQEAAPISDSTHANDAGSKPSSGAQTINVPDNASNAEAGTKVGADQAALIERIGPIVLAMCQDQHLTRDSITQYSQQIAASAGDKLGIEHIQPILTQMAQDQNLTRDSITRYQQMIADAITEDLQQTPKPDDDAVYSSRASAYYQKGDFDRAIADFTEAIRINPNDAKAYYGRGKAYRAKGDVDHALADLREEIRINPNDAEAYNFLGDTELTFAGHLTEATADFEQAVRLKPDFAPFHRNLSVALLEQGRTDEAKAQGAEANRLEGTPAK